MTAGLMVTPLDGWIAGRTGAASGRMTRAELEAYQLAQLNATIAQVWHMSSFYRRHFAAIGANGLTCLEELADYPVTTPADVMEYAGEMICGSQGDISRVVTLTTSGTTGKPKRLYFTSSDQKLTIDFFGCGMSTLVGPGDKTMILLPGERPGSVGELLFQGLLGIGARPIAYGLVQNLDDAVRTMCREEAVCLVGVPVQILAMARYWENWREDRWAPKCALLSTDYVSAAIVSELRRIWDCEVYEHYGMTEMGLGGGLECAVHQGYHLREADLYFEIIDPASARPCPDGEYGEVVFTTLTRQGMPLIRYRTGDISRFIVEPCPCGSRLRRLERVYSRQEGQVYFGPGWPPVTMAELDEVLFPLPGVVDFTASIVAAGQAAELTLVVEVLPEALPLDKSAILFAVRQLPAIRLAEQEGRLALTAEVACRLSLTPGKRSIRIVDQTGKETQSAG